MTCCNKCGAKCGETINCVPISELKQWRGVDNAAIVLRNPAYSDIPPGFGAKFGAFTEHDQLCHRCSAQGIIEMCRVFLDETVETERPHKNGS